MKSSKISVEQCKDYFRVLLHKELSYCDTLSNYLISISNTSKGHNRKIVSSGTFGTVFAIRYAEDGILRAAKVGNLPDDEEAQKSIIREEEVINKIRDKSIEGFPQYYETVIGKDKYIFVQELCQPVEYFFDKEFNSEEDAYYTEQNKINPKKLLEVKKLGIDILKAFEGLKTINRCHRDVKTSNILCKKIVNNNNTESHQYLLCDLGSVSVDLVENPYGTVPLGYTPEFTEPDKVRKDQIMHKSNYGADTFGLGASMYYLLVGKLPYKIIKNTDGDALDSIPNMVDLYSLCEYEKYHYIIYTIFKAISFNETDRYIDDIDSMIKDLSGAGDYHDKVKPVRRFKDDELENFEGEERDEKYYEIKDVSELEERTTKTMQSTGHEELYENDWVDVDASLPNELKEFISNDNIDIFNYQISGSLQGKEDVKIVSNELENYLVDDTIDIFDNSIDDSNETSDKKRLPKYLVDWITDDSINILG